MVARQPIHAIVCGPQKVMKNRTPADVAQTILSAAPTFLSAQVVQASPPPVSPAR